MSYGIFLLRFVDSKVVALDVERFRQVTEPYVVAGGPEEGFSQLRVEDGAKWISTRRPKVKGGCSA
ncbi:hypothetical protein [Streptomyces sp. NPDC055749]